jgi:hypothetical protein
MRQHRSSTIGLINILGLVALAGWSQPSSAQSPPSAKTTQSVPQCNLLHDLVPSDPANPLIRSNQTDARRCHDQGQNPDVRVAMR